MKQKEKKENQVVKKQQEEVERSLIGQWIDGFKERWERTFKTVDVRRGEMTVEDAINNMFGGNFEQLVWRKIKEVEDTIEFKSKTLHDSSASFIIQSKRDEMLFEKVRDHFNEKGFEAFIDSFPRHPEIKGLIIIWVE